MKYSPAVWLSRSLVSAIAKMLTEDDTTIASSRLEKSALFVRVLQSYNVRKMRVLDNRKFVCLVSLSAFLSIHSVCPVLAADDELQHFGVSAVCGTGVETYLHYKTELRSPVRMCLATVLGSVPGLTKEIIDSTQEDNNFSGSDMAADVIGALAGTVLSSVVNDAISVRIERGKDNRVSFSLTYDF